MEVKGSARGKEGGDIPRRRRHKAPANMSRSSTIGKERTVWKGGGSSEPDPASRPSYESDVSYLTGLGVVDLRHMSTTTFSRLFSGRHRSWGSRSTRCVFKLVHGGRGRKEVLALLSLQWNDGVVRMLGHSEEPSGRTLIILKMAPEDLYTHIKSRVKLCRPEAHRLFFSLCCSMVRSHSAGRVHRDIKPDNLLVEDGGKIVVGDWGMSTTWSSYKMRSRCCGSLMYMADELLDGSHYVGPELDVFSMGLVMYCMLTGMSPYRIEKGPPKEGGRRNKRTPAMNLSRLEEGDARIVAMMVHPDPIKRATMYEVLGELRDCATRLVLEPPSVSLICRNCGHPRRDGRSSMMVCDGCNSVSKTSMRIHEGGL